MVHLVHLGINIEVVVMEFWCLRDDFGDSMVNENGCLMEVMVDLGKVWRFCGKIPIPVRPLREMVSGAR